MSLKITVEVDGQIEQQIAPTIAQFIARHPEWASVQTSPDALTPSPDVYAENLALLQAHIQQLMAQNELLKMQVRQSQQPLEGERARPKALAPQAATFQRAVSAPTVAVSSDASDLPLLPVQYQWSKGASLRYRLKHSAMRLPARLWQTLVWLAFGKEWLLLFLLAYSGVSGTLLVAPLLADRFGDHFGKHSEFVDSAGEGPGAAATPATAPTPEANSQQQHEGASATQPVSPASKAGSHPPPPPAFQQP
ncbi:MAG: hypothetical protein AAF171_02020 [Cyanobacteria bacterium P01_A01_bin.116]